MPVKAADPAAIELELAGARIAGTLPAPKEPAAPSEIDPEAPHGRAPDGTPLAPFGWTKPDSEGKSRPKKTGAGRRPSAEEQPRTGRQEIPGSGSSSPSPAAADSAGQADTIAELAESAEAIWFGVSAIGMGGSAIPLVGRFIPETKISAQAYIFKENTPRLVKGLALAAEHNQHAARLVSRITGGGITWAAMSAMLVMPFMMQSAAVWKGADALAKAELPELAELAKLNETAVEAYLGEIAATVQSMSEAELEAALQNGSTPQ